MNVISIYEGARALSANETVTHTVTGRIVYIQFDDGQKARGISVIRGHYYDMNLSSTISCYINFLTASLAIKPSAAISLRKIHCIL